MPVVEKHAPGSFCWIEMAASDQSAAKDFYRRLFGWQPDDFPMHDGSVYTIFRLDGRDVAAGYSLMADQRAQGIPPNWMLYVATENADASAARAKELGGTILGGPFDAGGFGRMAIVRDPQGAVLAVWQAKANPGIGITGVPGTLCWADLSTPDAQGGRSFYAGLFGWDIEPGENDPGGYLHIRNGEAFIGGIPAAQYRDPKAPPHWLPYIAVTDCDTTANLAQQLGAQLYMPPSTIEKVGRMSILADPQGAVFAIFTEARHG
jgi:predicted enzyme related to lactoylglutathione lyase